MCLSSRATLRGLGRYGFALASVLLAVLLRWELPGVLGPTPFLAFYPAVVIAAILGGAGPGIVATAVSALCVGMLFDPTPGWEHIGEPEVLGRLGLFLIGGMGTSLAAGAIRASRAEARRYAEAVRESHDRLKKVVEVETVGVMFWDLTTGQMVDANETFLKMMGYSRSDVEQRKLTWQKLTPPEFVEVSLAEIRKFQATGRVGPYEKQYLRKDGTRQWLVFAGSSLGNNSCVEFCVDITDRKRAEEALRENEEQLRLAAQAAEIGMWSWEPGTSNVTVSANWRQLFGVGDDVPVTFETWRDALHPEDRERAAAELNAASEQHREFNVEYRVVRPDGAIRWITDRGRAWYDEQGRAVGMAGVNVDITVRKASEQALRESEQRVRRRLDALLLPEGDIGELELADIIDVAAVQALVEEGYRLMHIPMAIIDLKGKVLVGVGWQAICTEFHRQNAETCKYCIESDTQLTEGVAPGEFRLYRCKNSMWDVATPILVGGKHVGNLFTGQFFFDDEEVDRERFRAQARRYGFDEERYLAALDAAPRLSREAVQTGMQFFIRLADMFSQLSYSNIKLARSSDALVAAKFSAERAKHAAEEANRAKDHFLAMLSHELRTPLTPVVAAVHMLQEGVEDEQAVRDALEMIHRNVEMEARLIDDLLDVTRIVRGKVELQRQPVMLCEVIRRAVEVCKPDIEARRIHFGMDLGKDAPYRIDADPGRLQQVFWNLLKNAVKFTPHGGCIGIRCRHENGQVIVEIVDSGEGIEAQLLPRIFNAFEQGGARVTRQFGGLGLGLTITKGVVELHGGTIEAYSEGKGKGATFRVRLPICAGCEPTPAQPLSAEAEVTAQISTATGQKLRILLVEDHGDTAKVMRRLLSGRGYEVETAGDVATALELIEREPFDLLLSDLGLPDGSGMDLMRKLRERGRMVPGIALSGYGQEEDVRRSKEAGFAAHLTKPTNPDVLTRTIGAVIRVGRAM